MNLESIISILIFSFTVVLLIYLFNKYFPERFSWVTNEFSQLILVLGGQKGQNTADALINQHTFLPKGEIFFFGIGQRVFGANGLAAIGRHSDIGYINNLFKGGFFYLLVLYTTNIFYNLKNSNRKRRTVLMLIYILFANFKGEVMTNGMILLICYTLTLDDVYIKKIVMIIETI